MPRASFTAVAFTNAIYLLKILTSCELHFIPMKSRFYKIFLGRLKKRNRPETKFFTKA